MLCTMGVIEQRKLESKKEGCALKNQEMRLQDANCTKDQVRQRDTYSLRSVYLTFCSGNTPNFNTRQTGWSHTVTNHRTAMFSHQGKKGQKVINILKIDDGFSCVCFHHGVLLVLTGVFLFVSNLFLRQHDIDFVSHPPLLTPAVNKR